MDMTRRRDSDHLLLWGRVGRQMFIRLNHIQYDLWDVIWSLCSNIIYCNKALKVFTSIYQADNGFRVILLTAGV